MKTKSNNFKNKETFLASIDIGTNSTHLLIAKINPDQTSFSIEFTEKETTRLGERDDNGNLTKESIQRVLGTLKRFKEYCFSYQVEKIIAAGTSAVRESPNGIELINRVRDELGFDIELVSGVEEARLIYLDKVNSKNFSSRKDLSKYLENKIKKIYSSALSKKLAK